MKASTFKILEDICNMHTGYVLDFTNKSFSLFIEEAVGINIYEEKYSDFGESKANRLRSFFKKEPNHIVEKVVQELILVAKRKTPRKEEQIKMLEEIIKKDHKIKEDYDFFNKKFLFFFEKLFSEIKSSGVERETDLMDREIKHFLFSRTENYQKFSEGYYYIRRKILRDQELKGICPEFLNKNKTINDLIEGNNLDIEEVSNFEEFYDEIKRREFLVSSWFLSLIDIKEKLDYLATGENYNSKDDRSYLYFKNKDIEREILKNIKKASKSIYVNMYVFSSSLILEQLLISSKNNIDVQIIVDDNKKNREFFARHKIDFPLFYIKGFEKTRSINHNKYYIFDLERVISGTANATNKALTDNKENMIKSADYRVVREYVHNFLETRREFFNERQSK